MDIGLLQDVARAPGLSRPGLPFANQIVADGGHCDRWNGAIGVAEQGIEISNEFRGRTNR